jgi:hypothetical protein
LRERPQTFVLVGAQLLWVDDQSRVDSTEPLEHPSVQKIDDVPIDFDTPELGKRVWAALEQARVCLRRQTQRQSEHNDCGGDSQPAKAAPKCTSGHGLAYR